MSYSNILAPEKLNGLPVSKKPNQKLFASVVGIWAYIQVYEYTSRKRSEPYSGVSNVMYREISEIFSFKYFFLVQLVLFIGFEQC